MFDIMLKKLNGKIEDNTSYRLRANLKLGYEVIKGLNISTSLALDFTQANLNTFSPTYLDPTYHEAKSEGEIGRDLTLLNDNLVSYNFSLKEVHNFDLLLGLSTCKRSRAHLPAWARPGSQPWPRLSEWR